MKFDEISAIEAKEIIEQQQAVVLDVRSQMEYKEGHIKNAHHVPLEKLAYEIEEIVEEKQLPIILYCRSGHRTKTARLILDDLGYQAVYDLGGIYKWEEELSFS